MEESTFKVRDLKNSESNSRGRNVEKLTNEVNTMKRELEDMKEVLRGLIQVIMSRDGPLDEDEFN